MAKPVGEVPNTSERYSGYLKIVGGDLEKQEEKWRWMEENLGVVDLEDAKTSDAQQDSKYPMDKDVPKILM